VVQTGFAVLVGARIVLGPYRQLAGTPDELFDPVAVLAWLDHMPSGTAIAAIQVLGGLLAMLALTRRAGRLPFSLAWVCLLVLAGLRGSRGKVLHNDLLLVWTAVPFLLAPVEARWRDRAPRRASGWPIRSAMAIAAAVYALTGYHKLVTSGIDWALGDNVRYVLLWGSPASGRWDTVSTWVADNPVLFKGTGLCMLAVELTFPLCLLWRRAQPWYALAAVGLHVATYLFLGLDYWTWALAVLLLFVDWPALVDRARRRDSMASASAATSAVPWSTGRSDAGST
jgi:hypothetical protein